MVGSGILNVASRELRLSPVRMSQTASSMSRLAILGTGFRTAVAVITQNWLDCYLLRTQNPTWRCCNAPIRILLQSLQKGIFQDSDVSRIREGQVQMSEMPREQGRATAIPVLCCDLQEELRNTSTSKGMTRSILRTRGSGSGSAVLVPATEMTLINQVISK